jgi:hypothetical protein
MDDVRRTLEQRGRQYEQVGPTWKIVGQIISTLNLSVLQRTPYTHNWVQILGKLIRALSSPNDPEHWRDIAGYATLVLDDITTQPPPTVANYNSDMVPITEADIENALRGVVPTGDSYDIVPGK